MARTRRLGRASAWKVRRALGAAAVVVVCALVSDHVRADDAYATARRDVVGAQDFRVRVASALALGRSRDPASRAPLERALGDGHPAVRSAAAAALGALGESSAIPAMERQLASDPSESVRSQLRTSLGRLKGTPDARAVVPSLNGVRFVVELGAMRNSTGVRGADLAQVLRAATRIQTQGIARVAVAEAGDVALLKQAAEKKIPVVALDGTILELLQARRGETTTFHARVEYSLRRVSDQTLKGLLTGSASTFGSTRALTNQKRMSELQDQAVQGAAESALRGADKSVALAVR